MGGCRRRGRRRGGERELSRPTDGTKPEVPAAVFRWLVPACFGTILAACDSPDAGIDPELDTGAELEAAEPALLGSAHVPYSMSTSVALLDEHTACTVDSYETKIECFERSGRLVGRFGATGEGPGEFRFPSRLLRGSGGSLGVIDNTRGRFFAFTRTGELVAEFVLPTTTGVFIPASRFDTTIVGAYVNSYGSEAMAGGFGGGMEAAEILIATGEAVREWRPASVPEVPGCGTPYFGFPAMGGIGDGTWVFMACDGHIAFVKSDGETTILRAPTYGGELPGERDVEEHRETLERFNRRNGITTDFSGSLRRFAERPSVYYLARGQETYDERGRLWVSTRRDRNESSFIDVYAESEFRGTVRVRDRMIDFDLFEGILAVLVERQAGPDDGDGVPDRGIDWYDLGGF